RIVAQAILHKTPYRFHALAVLHDHVHAVIEHTERDIRRVVGHIKSEATRALRERGFFTEQRPWVEHGWNVFLDSDGDVVRAIEYVERNAAREGLGAQKWEGIV